MNCQNHQSRAGNKVVSLLVMINEAIRSERVYDGVGALLIDSDSANNIGPIQYLPKVCFTLQSFIKIIIAHIYNINLREGIHYIGLLFFFVF